MANFLSLVHNENVKIYARIRTWVMLFILAVLSVLMPVLMYVTDSGNSTITTPEAFQLSMSIIFMLNTIFTIVIAADSVAGEFSWGTVKLLLIRPWSRSKILLSKYISLILFSLLSTAVMCLLAFGASAILFPSSGGSYTPPEGWTGLEYSLMLTLCNYVQLFITAALAFMLSAVFRGSGLAIGFSLFLVLTKNIFIGIFNPERFWWAKYLIFIHMDLSVYLNSASKPGGLTLGFSLGALLVYYAVFMIVAWTVFTKRDVAA